jgi:thiamine-monophosphate kinase
MAQSFIEQQTSYYFKAAKSRLSETEVCRLILAEELGERKIIEIILEHLEPMPNMPVPFGDDVSALDIGNRRLAVMKTDMLVGKTDIPPGMDLWQAARKAVVMNTSDLAAKGVQPAALLASIGIPKDFTKRQIKQIGKGLNSGAREYDTYVLGGDTNESSDMIISCTAFGVVEERLLMTRSGAQPGDFVAVTGFFGKTSCGLKILLEDFSASPTMKNTFLDSVLLPKARLKEGLALADTRAVTASIDSSDGLAWCLHELSKASETGFLVDQLPAAPETQEFAKMYNLDPIELSLYGGEEYELTVTVKPALWRKAKEAVEKIGGALIKIGEATEKKTLVLEVNEKEIPIEPKGWEHFKQSRSNA